MIIDATDLILGRMATVAAKKLLLGEKIDIVNCENVYITGSKAKLVNEFHRRRVMGIPLQGPYFPKSADRIVRRTIRGMLPYKKDAGKRAFKNIMCYLGVPAEFQGKEKITIKESNISKVPNLKYMRLGQISKLIGARN